MTDHDLLQRFIDFRDQGAFAELVQRHVNLVYGVARRQAPADMEDVTQAVFLLLSQKARDVQRQTSISGWLFRAARYCCLNAQKVERRRRHHEQQAGGHMSTAPTTEELAAVLDDALADLPRPWREAVLLRYLEGRSVEETGAALRLTPAAAGKRATRGLEQLRAYFAKAGYTVGAAAVATTLLAESAKAAPAHLVPAIAGTVSSGVAAGKVSVLAKMAGKSMAAGVRMAVAAGMLVVVGIASGMVVALHRPVERPVNSGTAATMDTVAIPASTPAPLDEKQISGRTYIASYSVLLDPAGAEALSKATTPVPVPADTTFYQLQRSSAQRVREVLQRTVADGDCVAIGSFLYALPVDGVGWKLGDVAAFYNVLHSGSRYSLQVNRWDTVDAEPGKDALLLRLDANHENVALTRLDARRAQDVLQKSASVHWTGSIPPGDAAVMLGDFGEWHGDRLITATVYEVFKAKDYQRDYLIGRFDAKRWIELGPAGARAWVDRAWAWGHQSVRSQAETEKTHAKWSRGMSDGTVVTLCGIARPSKWAFCWWDGDGYPTPCNYGPGTSGGHLVGLDTALAAAVSVRRPGTSAPSISPPPDRNDRDYAAYCATIVPEDATQVSVYVPMGSWTEHAMKSGDTIDLGDRQLVVRTRKTGDNSCLIMLNGDWSPEYQARVSGILKNGTRIEDSGVHANIVVDAGNENEETFGGYFGAGLTEIDHFVVATRHREAVAFDGFARIPVVSPAAPTTEALAAASQQYLDAEAAATGDRLEAEWESKKEEWAKLREIPRDETAPEGAVRVLLDKAQVGDIAGVRACLTGKDAEAMELVAEQLAAEEHIWNLGVQKFGEDAVQREVARRGVAVLSGEYEYLGYGWEVRGDRATHPHGWLELVRVDGKWRLDADRWMGQTPKRDYAERVRRTKEEEKRLAEDLNSGKIADARVMALRLEAILASINGKAQTQPAQ